MKFKDMTIEEQREQVKQGEKEINELLAYIQDYVNKHRTDPNVLISTMVAIIGRMISEACGTDVKKQDELIEFTTGAIRVSLAENGYRPNPDDMMYAIPPWEKN